MSTATDNSTWPLLLEAASHHNVLTLTSACNTSCVFCSHRQNPPGVLAYSTGRLDLEELYV